MEDEEAANLLACKEVIIKLEHNNNADNNGCERCKHKSNQNHKRVGKSITMSIGKKKRASEVEKSVGAPAD